MEVPGKREINDFSCKPCEENDIFTQADGFCMICEENMCSSCFETHKKWKLNRDHTLIDCNEEVTQRENPSDFEKCEQHLNETVKFYCAQHGQVGCGDCMVTGHRSCKVDYITDIKDTAEFKSLTKGPEKCKIEAEHVLSSIKNNIVQIGDINGKFIQEVNMFREEIISKVNNLSDRMLKEGECIKTKDNLSMKKLADETESLINDLNDMSDLFKSKVGSPSQLFVCSVSKKPKLDQVRKQIDDIKSRNIIDSYEFKRDTNLSRTLASTCQLGEIQEGKEEDVKASIGQLGKLQKDKKKNVIGKLSFYDEEEIKEDQGLKSRKSASKKNVEHVLNFDCHSSSVIKNHVNGVERKGKQHLNNLTGCNVTFSAEAQPLLDRQLMCRNIKVDGEYLSYVDNGDRDVGLYVDKNVMMDGKYFEIEILSLGRHGTIAIGLVPNNYPDNMQPGWGRNSIGYQADNGHVYHEFAQGTKFGPKCLVGDKIGCFLFDSVTRYSQQAIFKLILSGLTPYIAVFTRNGKKVGENELRLRRNLRLYAAVGMRSSGEKVKVILDAKITYLRK